MGFRHREWDNGDIYQHRTQQRWQEDLLPVDSVDAQIIPGGDSSTKHGAVHQEMGGFCDTSKVWSLPRYDSSINFREKRTAGCFWTPTDQPLTPKIPWVTCFDPKRRKRHIVTSEILKESEKALEEERRKADSEQTLGTSWIAIQHYLTKPTKII